MAHSYLVCKDSEYEVRDSICEIVLERLKVGNWSSQLVEGLVSEWYRYWLEMPPGSKELDLNVSSISYRNEIIEMLTTELLPTVDKNSELADVIKKMSILISKGK